MPDAGRTDRDRAVGTLALDRTAPSAPGEGAPRSTLGRFVVAGTLGSGGMGVVFDAFDPALDRRVAVKLLKPDLWGSSAGDGERRLHREAQAMARLSHPNVVTVHEVGTIGEQAYLVMELVDGETLRQWQAKERTWRELVLIYVEAGRGLVAAHEAGLVHRDFKPENVLVGRDGRPRVGDFGLVSSGVAIDAGAAGIASIAGSLTVRGAVLGTPGYMAPEQWQGQETDARTDQFAFCVALWEAVFGQRPFAGPDVASIRAAVLDGTPVAAHARRAPRWLSAALARGLARDPAHRWPSLRRLLDELASRARPRRVPAPVLAGIAAAVAGAAVFAIAPSSERDPCPSPDDRLAGIWDGDVRSRLGRHLASIDPEQHRPRFERAARIFDDHRRDWRAMHVETCRATRVEGRQSDSLLDQRMACLDERLAELAGTIELIAGVPDAVTLDRALPALRELQPVADCASPGVIASFRPPADLTAGPIANEIVAEARAIELDRRAGRLEGLAARADSVAQRARELGHPPLLARVLFGVSRVHADLTDSIRAIEILRELVDVAARAGDDHASAYAWNNLLRFTAFDLGRPSDALVILPAARAAVIRSGDGLEERVLLLAMEAEVLQMVDRMPEAVANLDEAIRLLHAAGADQADSPLRWLVADVRGRQLTTWIAAVEYERALEAGEAALVATADAYGPDHPDAAYELINMGEAYRRLGRLDEALAVQERALRIRERRIGPSPALAWVLNLYANSLRELGRAAEALPHAERAHALAREQMADDDPNRIAILLGTAVVYEALERFDETRVLYDEAIALGDRTGARNNNVPITLFNRGDISRKLGQCERAIPDYQRADALFAEYQGADSYYRIFPLRGVGECAIAIGNPELAITALETAITLRSPGFGAEELPKSKLLLGEALVRGGRDVRRGRALVAEAWTEARALGDAAVAELDAIAAQLRGRGIR